MGSLGVGSGTKNFGRQVEVCKSPEDFGYGVVTSSNQKYVDQAIEVPTCLHTTRFIAGSSETEPSKSSLQSPLPWKTAKNGSSNLLKLLISS